MNYLWLKVAHQLLAVISICGFILRWSWRMQGSSLAYTRLARTLPHIIDTLFLASGLALAWVLTLLPALPIWLLAKLMGLLAYIVLGAVAMRSAPHARSIPVFIAAIVCFLWIVTMATGKSPLGIFRFLGAP